jgi:predicted  nucleic acid-binding Zn-ribbon protein
MGFTMRSIYDMHSTGQLFAGFLKPKHSKDSSTTANTIVCIAGAHRSGTSMLARLLHDCGLYLGRDSDLVPGRADNPDGFWENRCFVALNDEVLNELGGAWDLPPETKEISDSRRLDPLRVKAQLLIEGFDSASAWGWKDPRNCLTLPFWRKLLPELKVLVIVRNPLEVAYSLRNRNEDTSYSFGLRLWEIYNRRLIETSKAKKRLVIEYDAFFKDAESELRRIACFAGLPDANIKSAAALVQRGRRHVHFTTEQLIDARASAEVTELYRALIAEARQGAKALTTKGYNEKIAKPSQIAKPQGSGLLPGSISRLNVSIPNSETVRREFDRVLRQAASPTQILKVYADQGEGYSETLSVSVPLIPDIWQTLKIEGVHRLHTNRSRRLRIDPVGPAFVSLSRIAIVREEDEALLYSAECLADFAKLDLSAGLLKQEVGEHLLLLATDSDPQIYLPVIENLGEDPYRLELTLKVQSATRGAVQRQHKALEEQSRLSALLEGARAEITALRSGDLARLKSIGSLEAELHNSKKSIGSLEQQKRDLEAELSKSKNALQQSYDEATRLSSVVQNQKSLQERLDGLSRRITAARNALKPAKSSVGTLFDSIDREIRRIRHRSVWWKLGMALCQLFPKTHPARDIFPDRKEMARELKRALQEIRRALFSKNASTEKIALGLGRVLELQRRVQQVSVSLRFANRIRFLRRDGETRSTVTRVSNLSERSAVRSWLLRSQINSEPLLLPDNRLARVFDATWYLREHPEIAAQGIDPLEHYIERGAKDGCNPHPLFDTTWYLTMNPDVRSANINPFEHYIETGGREGRDPHPLFSSKWYLEQYLDVASAGLNPLVHYITAGAKERRSPHPMFDAHFYAEKYSEAADESEDLLQHYLTVGWKKGFKPNPKFDPEFYLRTYPDVAEAGMDPLTHFVLQGRAEGRVPCAQDLTFEPYCSSFEIPREPAPMTGPVTAEVKAIAFYLPQFHAIPENDEWWGKGFTEWTNVRGGSSNFEGHYQPHVPSVLGYYDLRDPSVLQKQAKVAASYGIYGFCFHYYWFAGTVLLDLPLQQMINSTDLNFPFCICWANENWTRRWDGKEQEILISQHHSPKDDLAFIRKIEPILLHKNYIRVEGNPLLAVYRPSLFPDPVATTTRWRSYFRECGHGELHLAMVRSFNDQTPPESYGFDAAIQFPPHCPANAITSLIPDKSEFFTGTVFDYTELKKIALNQLKTRQASAKMYPGVMPSWDNTARRRERATVWVNSCPESYYEWLSAVVAIASTKTVNERLIFINAWNEWAEGCHLEPDERFGFAWLNATSLALHEPPQRSQDNDPSYIIPPVQQCIEVPRLPDTVRLTISVLFYHRDDLIPSFLQSILPQIRSAKSRGDISCCLYLVFNYKVAAPVQADIGNLINSVFPEGASDIYIRENGFNIGFGAGHNAIFEESESDLFLILNSDVRVLTENWLEVLVDRFRESGAALIGLAKSASRLREDGCGIPIERAGEEFDFVDGSVLAIRSALARRYGLFSDAFDYFYFEDVDLCLRYRQMGLHLELLDVPCEHDRSSSSRLLPQYAVEGVLNRNRARFFARWGGYLQTRKLPNRLGLRFIDIDRQLQCASLPALLALLSDHPTATLDVFGLHEQLVPIFKHPRIRLIPFWKTFQKDDYLRDYEIERDSEADQPLTLQIANTVGCVPDFEAARAHLNSIALDKVAPTSSKTALLYVARKEPLFDGRQPHPKCYVATEEFLSCRGFQIQLWTELGTFEIEKLPVGKVPWKHAATASSLELLYDIAGAELVISTDNWISELSQLMNKKTFLWLGATAPEYALWNLQEAGVFVDGTLSCLGCYHSFGRNNHNTCLRGDTACVRQELSNDFIAALERFLEGSPVTAADIQTGRQLSGRERSMPSASLSLDRWPRSSANSVLVLIPISPSLDQATAQCAEQLARRATEGMRACRIVLDNTGIAPSRGCHPQRQSGLAALRQNMIERHLRDEKWIFWVDADVVAYPAHLLEQLIARIDGGIAAPIVIMEGRLDEPANKAGFGPGRFYDIAGFVERGRWARFTQPYFDQIGPVYELDSVGSCYLVNADLYRWGGRHEIDVMSSNFVSTNSVWSEHTIHRNQEAKANCFTEHYSICSFARSAGLPVRAFGDLIAYHQKS